MRFGIKNSRRVSMAATAVALASAGVLLQAAPASAGTTISVYTTDGGWGPKGGAGLFWHDGNGAAGDREVFGARDQQGDGKRVVVQLAWRSGGAIQTATVEDTNGANNGVVTAYAYIPEGAPVTVTVCLQDGPGAAWKFCGSREAIA
ncbi:hypothetical protein JNUCC64_14825 [Streptomyces sp. JNUCC 64]